MKTEVEAEIVTVLGQRGSGKSSWVKQRLPSIPRFIVWDTLGEYAKNRGAYKGFDEVQDREDLYRYVEKRRDGFFQVVFNSLSEDDISDLDFACELAMAVKNVTLVIEEVDAYATPSFIPLTLKKLLKVGRHDDIPMIFVSRRPAEINRLITSQSRRFICFAMVEPLDIRYLTSVVGPAARELPEFPFFRYLDWQHGKIERREIKW